MLLRRPASDEGSISCQEAQIMYRTEGAAGAAVQAPGQEILARSQRREGAREAAVQAPGQEILARSQRSEGAREAAVQAPGQGHLFNAKYVT